MGKSKELFMQFREREYLMDDLIAQVWQEEAYEELKNELNQPLTTKIEISDGTTTRIQVSEEKLSDNTEVKISEFGF